MVIRRAAAVKYKTPEKVNATLSGPHAHGCTKCRGRYEDSCNDSNSNGRCRGCMGQIVWDLLRRNRLPKDCCRVHSRPTRKEDRKTYRLSPACDWFICTSCARTHPFHNPTEVHA